jgi:hypothetical protein
MVASGAIPILGTAIRCNRATFLASKDIVTDFNYRVFGALKATSTKKEGPFVRAFS